MERADNWLALLIQHVPIPSEPKAVISKNVNWNEGSKKCFSSESKQISLDAEAQKIKRWTFLEMSGLKGLYSNHGINSVQ